MEQGGGLTWPRRPLPAAPGPAAARAPKPAALPRRAPIVAGRRLSDRADLHPPYLEMFLTALRPVTGAARPRRHPAPLRVVELHRCSGPPASAPTCASRLVVAGGATVLVLLVALPGGVLHGAAQVPRPQGVPAAGAGHADVPADRDGRRHLRRVPRPELHRLGLGADPGQRRLQPGLRGLDPERLLRRDPASSWRRPRWSTARPARRDVPA